MSSGKSSSQDDTVRASGYARFWNHGGKARLVLRERLGERLTWNAAMVLFHLMKNGKKKKEDDNEHHESCNDVLPVLTSISNS